MISRHIEVAARLVPCLMAGIVLTACSMPRDPAGTMDRVESSGKVRLGIVADAPLGEPARRTLKAVLADAGAQLDVQRGDSERLLTELEQGKLDLVYGNFAADSPWKKLVYFGKAQGRLGKPATSEPVPRFAMMLGENGWIMEVERASR